LSITISSANGQGGREQLEDVRIDYSEGGEDHSLRVTALTTARERDSDIIDLQDFAGYAQLSITGVELNRSAVGFLCVSLLAGRGPFLHPRLS
jgi:hypothetical protein